MKSSTVFFVSLSENPFVPLTSIEIKVRASFSYIISTEGVADKSIGSSKDRMNFRDPF